jgi:hypothetical protein
MATLNVCPPQGIPTFGQRWVLCGHTRMIPKATPAVAYATGSSPQARQVKGEDPDKKGYSGPLAWGLGVGLTT